jgi:hypothetical protein
MLHFFFGPLLSQAPSASCGPGRRRICDCTQRLVDVCADVSDRNSEGHFQRYATTFSIRNLNERQELQNTAITGYRPLVLGGPMAIAQMAVD